MSAAMQVNGLTVLRGGRAVVDGVDLTLDAGEVVALIGPNGAGKSSLLLALLGRLPSTGTMHVAGVDARQLDARARARTVAWVPQRSGLRAPLSVRQVVAAGRFARSGMLARLSSTDHDAVERSLAAVVAGALADRRFDQLSCGEQQRVLLARALATEAPVLLLDEPTAGLDPGHALALLALVRRLAAAGRAVLMALHHLDEVAAVADRVALLQGGRLLTCASPSTVLTPEWLRSTYGVEPLPGGGLGLRLLERQP